MRTNALRLRLCLLLAALPLTSCPGTLSEAEQQRFADYAPPASAGSGGGGNMAGAPTGEAGEPPTMQDPCGDVPTRVFAATCSGTGCHGATAAQQELDLVSPGVAERVVGVPGKSCLQLLADPENPEASLLYSKLLPGPDCGGAQMPLARPPLSATDVACVRAWIAAQ